MMGMVAGHGAGWQASWQVTREIRLRMAGVDHDLLVAMIRAG